MTVSVFYELVNYSNQIGSVNLNFKYLHFDEILLLIFLLIVIKYYSMITIQRKGLRKWIYIHLSQA